MTPELGEDTVIAISDGNQYKLVIDNGTGVFEKVDDKGNPLAQTNLFRQSIR